MNVSRYDCQRPSQLHRLYDTNNALAIINLHNLQLHSEFLASKRVPSGVQKGVVSSGQKEAVHDLCNDVVPSKAVDASVRKEARSNSTSLVRDHRESVSKEASSKNSEPFLHDQKEAASNFRKEARSNSNSNVDRPPSNMVHPSKSKEERESFVGGRRFNFERWEQEELQLLNNLEKETIRAREVEFEGLVVRHEDRALRSALSTVD